MEPLVNLASTLSSADAARIHWDAVVIGAGVGGAIAARELARTGHKVLLVDKRGFPRRKVCGACLNLAALRILDQLGLGDLVDSLGGQPLDRFFLKQGSRSLSLLLPGGRALSREAFDTGLVAAAIQAGVEFLPEVTASLTAKASGGHEVRLTQLGQDVVLRPKAIVVAAGLGGIPSAESSEWKTSVSRLSRVGTGCTIDDSSREYSPGTIWMAASRQGYVGLVRVEEGRLNLAASLDRQLLRDMGSPAEAARHILESAQFVVPRELPSAEWQGTVPLTRNTSPVAVHRTFLIGDAAGYVEPFTGEGMTWAMLSGQCVTKWVQLAIRNDDSSHEAAECWCREYRQGIQKRQRFCRMATRLIRSPAAMKCGMEILTRWPWLLRKLVAQLN